MSATISHLLCAVLEIVFETLDFDICALLALSRTNRQLQHHISTSATLWKMICYGATCNTCFECAHCLREYSLISDALYWRQVAREVLAVKRLRRQWGYLVETRAFINRGSPAALMYSYSTDAVTTSSNPRNLTLLQRLAKSVVSCFRNTQPAQSTKSPVIECDYVGSQLAHLLDSFLLPLGPLFLSPPSTPMHWHPQCSTSLLRLSAWRKLDRHQLIKNKKIDWVIDMLIAVGGFSDTDDVRAAAASVSWFTCFVGPTQQHTSEASWTLQSQRSLRAKFDALTARLVVVAVRFPPGGKVAKFAGITNNRRQNVFQYDVINMLLQHDD